MVDIIDAAYDDEPTADSKLSCFLRGTSCKNLVQVLNISRGKLIEMVGGVYHNFLMNFNPAHPVDSIIRMTIDISPKFLSGLKSKFNDRA